MSCDVLGQNHNERADASVLFVDENVKKINSWHIG